MPTLPKTVVEILVKRRHFMDIILCIIRNHFRQHFTPGLLSHIFYVMCLQGNNFKYATSICLNSLNMMLSIYSYQRCQHLPVVPHHDTDS